MTKIPVQPENSHFTPVQWQAIYQTDTNLLVSASAGSGKTTVLVQRIIEKIRSGLNINQLLVVTFTKAAAQEMKERLLKEVRHSIQNETNESLKQHYIAQLSLIPTANISTIDAFCQWLIGQYFYLIDLDPNFRLMTDATEIGLLKEQVWEALREDLYKEEQTAFYQLTENFAGDRGDQRLSDLVFQLHLFACSNPQPEAWLRAAASGEQETALLAETKIYQKMKPQLLGQLQRILKNYQLAGQLSEDLSSDKFRKLIEMEQLQTQQILTALEADQLERVYALFESLTFQRFPVVRKMDEMEVPVKDQVKSLRDANKKQLEERLQGIFRVAPTETRAILKKSETVVAELVHVTLLFMEEFQKVKKQKALLEFNDLEHYALQILASYDPKTQAFKGSEAAEAMQKQFVEVMVDEYQDVNPLQETLLNCVARANNLFMVGDVKQSIYAFRLADPTLFIAKYQKYGEKKQGERLILAENFRSRRNVIDFTNLIFSQMMDENVGELVYDDEAALQLGFQDFPEKPGYDTEFLLYETGQEQPSEDVSQGNEAAESSDGESLELETTSQAAGEILMTALKIKELMAQPFMIYDKRQQVERPLNYGDIVILSSTRGTYGEIQEIFKELQIPVEISGVTNYFQRSEIKTMLALLQIIDNPYQDIPFAAVLRSPLVGLDENQLALIRQAGKTLPFYEAFLTFLEKSAASGHYSGEFIQKLLTFQQNLKAFRELAAEKSLAELIWKIYETTGFLDYVGGLPMGAQRQSNLQALYQRAESYEAMNYKGLFQFVRFIEKMQKRQEDIGEPAVLDTAEQAVRVMTIHGSKGLEFPVVFVINLTRRLNLPELNQDYILDSKLGIGIKYLDDATRVKYDSLPYLYLRQERKKKAYAEEMRKLYVALTRAEQKLFLVGSYKDQATMEKKWQKDAENPQLVLSETARIDESRSFMDWLGLAVMRHPDIAAVLPAVPYAGVPQLKMHPAHFSVTWQNDAGLRQQQEQLVSVKTSDETNLKADESLFTVDEQVRAAVAVLDYAYPYQAASRTTSFQSVSELKRLFEDPEQNELVKIQLDTTGKTKANRYTASQLKKPKFLEKTQKVSAAETGTAVHLMLQLLPLKEKPTLAQLEVFRQALVGAGLITENVSRTIPLSKIAAFFETDFGRTMLRQKEHLHREKAFSMLLKARDLFEDYPPDAEDEILIHGIIDGYLETPDELILYDFKTDYLPDANPAALQQVVARYRGQLRLYGQALSEILARPVDKTYLILLSINQVLLLE